MKVLAASMAFAASLVATSAHATFINPSILTVDIELAFASGSSAPLDSGDFIEITNVLGATGTDGSFVDPTYIITDLIGDTFNLAIGGKAINFNSEGDMDSAPLGGPVVNQAINYSGFVATFVDFLNEPLGSLEIIGTASADSSPDTFYAPGDFAINADYNSTSGLFSSATLRVAFPSGVIVDGDVPLPASILLLAGGLAGLGLMRRRATA